MRTLLFLTLLFLLSNSFAQQITLKGVVVDKANEETLPFIVVDVPGTSYKTKTDFDGNFKLVLDSPQDSLRVTCFGFRPFKMAIPTKPSVQTLRIEMVTNDIVMQEVEIVAPENPAWPIMRNVIANKKKNDKRNLLAYQYETYSKSELAVDNISQDFKDRKYSKKIVEALEKSGTITDEYGNEIIPVFISETISDYYYCFKPEAQREYIKATKVEGVGVENQSFISQLMGSSFQETNFYKNSVGIGDVQFISPISDGWKGNYIYVLEDTVVLDGVTCFELDIKPKRPQDLAFWGNIWISDSTFALKRIDVKIPKDANLNFIEDIKIYKNWEQTTAGPWLSNETKVLIDLSDVGANTPSMLLKINTTNRDIQVDKPKEKKFYEQQIELAEDAENHASDYWLENRHDTLSAFDEQSFAIIDSLKNAPIIKTYVDIFDFVFFGYRRQGKVDIGPYSTLYAYNEVEEHRLRVGFKTNHYFSKKIVLNGYVAYGTGDEKLKYKGGIKYIASRKKWTEIGGSYKYDLEQLGVTDKFLEGNAGALFNMFARWGNLTGPYYNKDARLYAFRQVSKNFSHRLTLRSWEFNPIFPFAYHSQYPEKTAEKVTSKIQTSEVILRSHFGKNELFLQRENSRLSAGVKKWPVLDLQYTYGASVLESDLEYHRLEMMISQSVGMNTLGYSKYKIYGGKIFNTVPYPLLNVHLGNEFFIYNDQAFSLMNFFEFVSDQYIVLRHEHHFSGFVMNRIPLMRKLKWRLVTNVNFVYGQLSDDNIDIIAESVSTVSSLENEPYVEVGYGIENIFKMLRIQMFHRLTHLNKSNVDDWGIKVGFQFAL